MQQQWRQRVQDGGAIGRFAQVIRCRKDSRRGKTDDASADGVANNTDVPEVAVCPPGRTSVLLSIILAADHMPTAPPLY